MPGSRATPAAPLDRGRVTAVAAGHALRAGLDGVVHGVRRGRATAVAVVVLWLVGAATHALLGGPPPAVLAVVGAGVGPLSHGGVDTLLTSVAWCSGLPANLAATACLVGFVGPAEARLGTARAAGLFTLTQVIGLGAVLGVVALGRQIDPWAAGLADDLVVGPFAGAIGTGLALSSRFSVLWRRRVRLVVLVGLVLLVLYSGELTDVVRLAASPTRSGPSARSGWPTRAYPRWASPSAASTSSSTTPSAASSPWTPTAPCTG